MRAFSTVEELAAAVGEELGPSDWLEVTQERVDAFADATMDHQWIHVDRERSAAGPFGGTVAHGYLTLSLLPFFSAQVLRLETTGAKLNYGLEKVRFPAPVPVGGRLRATATPLEVTAVAAGHRLVTRFVLHLEGSAKPACVADSVTLLL